MYGIAMLLSLTAPLSPTPAVSNASDVSPMIVPVESGSRAGAGTSTGRDTSKSADEKDTYAGRGTKDEGKKQPGGDEQHPQHRSVSPSHLGPQGGSTADSGKAKHDQAAQAEQEAAKSTMPR